MATTHINILYVSELVQSFFFFCNNVTTKASLVGFSAAAQFNNYTDSSLGHWPLIFLIVFLP